ncbi:MAG: histone deacetylase [Bryobacteraceae bacterium]|nr:histone deacetylase [Bryobacteraceae bacterium]
MSGPPRLYYCDHYAIPLPEGHKFPMRKYAMVRDLLRAGGGFVFQPADFAAPETIMLAHEADYVRRFLDGTLDRGIIRRIGFPWSEGLVRRTLASVGGSLAAADDAMNRGWGGNLAGGTHHAFRAEGAGFCVFNDIAVVIEKLRAEGRVRRVAVIDLDVHQGDGTARIFQEDPGVLTLSMHGRNNFPFRKQQSKLDVEFADGTGDEEYLQRLAEVLPVVFNFGPGLVIYQSGVDALASDTLGRLALSLDGLKRRDRAVMDACRAYGAPLLITLGGGYSQPLELTAEAHANTFRTAAAVFGGAR